MRVQSSTIAVCMIARDGAKTIGLAIESVRPYVDEICVYLAGESSDGTDRCVRRLSEQPGARIRFEHGEWRHNFAWARNQSFAMASPRVEWLMWLDTDEVLKGGENLRGVLRLAADEDRVVAHHAWEKDFYWDRIVRARSAPTWVGVVHESLAGRPSDPFVFVNDNVLSTVHLRMGGGTASTPRNIEILLRAEEVGLDDGRPRARRLYLLGREFMWLGDTRRAVEYLLECVASSEGERLLERVQAMRLLAECCRTAEDIEDAGRWESRAAAEWAGLDAEAARHRFLCRAAETFARSMVSPLDAEDPCWCSSQLPLRNCCGAPVHSPVLVVRRVGEGDAAAPAELSAGRAG